VRSRVTFAWGDVLRTSLSAELHDRFIRALARQRIIWSAGHVHRVAAHANFHTTKYYLVRWYLRPFMRTWTATEYFALLEIMASSIGRIFSAADLAAAHGRDKVSVPGRPGAALTTARLIATPIEAALSPAEQEAVLATRSFVREEAMTYRDRFHELRTDPARNNQESIYEAFFGLSAIAALYFIAYRFAQDEAAMLEVLNHPSRTSGLFDLRPPAFPSSMTNDADAKANRRALHMLAAYRPAILRDPDASAYVPEEVIAAETSTAAARALLGRIGRGEPLTKIELSAMGLFDIDHSARACRG
jgi:hypothetical protein